jgi:hypothetical protein
MSLVTSRSQVRQYSTARMRSVFGVMPEHDNCAARYNERMQALQRVMRNPGLCTPKSSVYSTPVLCNRAPTPSRTPAIPRRSSLGSSEWKRAREQSARRRKTGHANVRMRSYIKGCDVQRILNSLDRVRSLLESSS